MIHKYGKILEYIRMSDQMERDAMIAKKKMCRAIIKQCQAFLDENPDDGSITTNWYVPKPDYPQHPDDYTSDTLLSVDEFNLQHFIMRIIGGMVVNTKDRQYWHHTIDHICKWLGINDDRSSIAIHAAILGGEADWCALSDFLQERYQDVVFEFEIPTDIVFTSELYDDGSAALIAENTRTSLKSRVVIVDPRVATNSVIDDRFCNFANAARKELSSCPNVLVYDKNLSIEPRYFTIRPVPPTSNMDDKTKEAPIGASK